MYSYFIISALQSPITNEKEFFCRPSKNYTKSEDILKLTNFYNFNSTQKKLKNSLIYFNFIFDNQHSNS